MKINKQILHIPPYISTSWDNIVSISTREYHLIITLKNSMIVEIPNLNGQIIELIFDTHAKVLESGTKTTKASFNLSLPQMTNTGYESLYSAMQHDPSQKDASDL